MSDKSSDTGGRQSWNRGFKLGIAVTAVGFVALVIIVSLAWPSAQAATPSSGQSVPATAERVDVVYFHLTQRCSSCQWAGATSRWTVETFFPDELASGRVTFREVNVEDPQNGALAEKYRASGSSLFVNYVSAGKDHIVEVIDSYPYVGNEARFSGILRDKILAGLGG